MSTSRNMLDRRVLRPSMIAGARIAVGRGALCTHRQLCRELDPIARLGYELSLAYAISLPTHDRRANAIANAIVLGGALLRGETIYEAAKAV